MENFLKQSFLALACFIVFIIITRNFIPYQYENEEFYSKFSEYKSLTQKESINTLFFGSSRIHHQISPKLFDKKMADYKLRSYNFSIAGTFNPESYFLLENFLKKNVEKDRVKLIIVELQSFNNLYSRNIFSHKASYWNNFNVLFLSWRYILSSDYSNSEKIKLLAKYSISFFYRFISFPEVQEFNKIKNRNEEFGFISLNSQYFRKYPNSFKKEIQKRLKSDSLEISNRKEAGEQVNLILQQDKSCNPVLMDKFSNLIKLAEKKNIQLVFMIPPRLTLKDYKLLLPYMNCLPESNIVQLADIESYPQFYDEKYIIDRGHLNEQGANILTEKLCNLLKSKNILVSDF